ncbi:hypothetical protein P8864_08645 [Priestia flexa]|jgi:hypothetical protein|nr:hypothetical protein [Priestia flexa]MEC0665997.1 hypothetical protein [Priestia flexa]
MKTRGDYMLLSHHVTVEQRKKIKHFKQLIRDSRSAKERLMYQQQLNQFVERLFIENRLQRHGEHK